MDSINELKFSISTMRKIVRPPFFEYVATVTKKRSNRNLILFSELKVNKNRKENKKANECYSFFFVFALFEFLIIFYSVLLKWSLICSDLYGVCRFL